MIITFCFVFVAYAQEEKIKDIYKNKGYFNITKITYYRINNATVDLNNFLGVNVKGSNSFGYSLQTINGYFLNPKFSIGIGTGLELFNNPNTNTLPVFLDFRYYFDNNYSSLYIFGDAGPVTKLGSKLKKGFLYSGGVGYKFFVNSAKTMVFVVDIGYFHRGFDVASSNLMLNGPSVSSGMIFNPKI